MSQIILDSANDLIQGDFDNATLNNRTRLQTTTTNATSNVYVIPNGSATSAGVSISNNSSLTNASKIVMATNGSTDVQIISGVNGSGTYLPLSFYTNNALAMQITTGGIISAAGGGIQFPATQIPSANANTLDDYEEGTFTPRYLVNGVESTGVTYGAQFGAYTKIGNVVTATVFLALTNKGSSTGAFTAIGNFPFPTIASPAYLQAGTFGYTVNFTTLAPTTGYNDNGTSYFLLFNPSASNWIGSSNITNTTNLSFSVTYLTSS